MERLTPDAEQEAIIQQMVNEPTRAALNASLYGTGKTLVTVEVGLRLGGRINLVAAPKNTVKSWEATIKRQSPDATVHHVNNSNKAGRAGMAALKALEPGWYIIGRELMLNANTAPTIAGLSKHIDFLAFDECQLWSNRKSQGFARMKHMKPGYKLALSATPYGNKFQNLWAITRWLWPERIPRSFWAWVAEWCKQKFNPHSPRTPDIVGELHDGEFVKTLPCYARLEASFGKPMHEEIVVELSSKERNLYNQIEKNMIAWLGDNPLVVKFPTTKRQRLRQMTLGEIHLDEDDVVDYPLDMKSTKLDTLMEIVAELPNEPMLILTHSQKYARVVTHRMQEAGLAAYEWSGKVSQIKREAIKELFMRGEIDYIVATPGAIGEGTDGLQHRARVMVWLSRDDNNMLNEQAFRRLHRRGQERRVLSIDIVAADTYDRGQLSSLIEQSLAVNRTLKKS